MPIRGVLFDMDGLLFDTERVASEAARYACQEMGVYLSDEILSQLYGSSLIGGRAVMEKYFGPGFSFTEYRRIMEAEMATVLRQKNGLRPLPGAAALLPWLGQQGYRCAIASSTHKNIIDEYLAMAGFNAYFDAVVGGDMVQRSKPAPDIFIMAAQALALAPCECLALEDSPNGIKSASAAGCHTVMIPNMVPATPALGALCVAVLGSLADVKELLGDSKLDIRR